MALTLSELQAKRDELVNALGIEAVRNGEDSIQYADVEKAIAAVDKEIEKLSASSSGTIVRRRTVATFSGGF